MKILLGGLSVSLSIIAIACTTAGPDQAPSASHTDALSGSGSQQLSGYITTNLANAPFVGVVAPSTVIPLAIGLPIRNQAGLTKKISSLSDPKLLEKASNRSYLTPAQFASSYGATDTDYQALIAFANAHHLSITKTYTSHLLLDVQGTASDIEHAFYVDLNYYQRPDGSSFYAPDREPSLDLSAPVLRISGLDNYFVMTPADGGTGPWGGYVSHDLRNAYAGCSTLDGTGQSVGLYEVSDFFDTDIRTYEAMTSLPEVPLERIRLNGFSGTAFATDPQGPEIALDIEAAQAMAPGLSRVRAFEGRIPASILHAMAEELPLSLELSSSYFWGDDDGNVRQALEQFVAQGQSFYQASGDNGGFGSAPDLGIRSERNVTLVGGTVLDMADAGETYISEAGWDLSVGGSDHAAAIPDYQYGIDMSTNGGSTGFRNVPDVAMPSESIAIISNGGVTGVVGGTSASAPLWAGFMALVNQQTIANGESAIGFPNPLLYGISRIPTVYGATFHDVTTGSNGPFNAVAGYDLVTGLGSPTCNLISQLAGPAPLTPPAFQGIDLQVTTGGDDLRGDSSAQASLFLPGATTPFQTVTLKAQTDPSWANGSSHHLVFTLDEAVGALGQIVITLVSHNSFPETNDNWDIASIDASLVNEVTPSPPGTRCAAHLAGNPLVRLTGDVPSVTVGVPDGCP